MARLLRKISKTKTKDVQSTDTSLQPFCLLSRQHASRVTQEVAEQLQIDVWEIEDMYPCTPFQEDIISRSAQNPAGYTAQKTYALPRSCAFHQFKAAWGKVFQANPILRTRIIQTDIGLVQVVLRAHPQLVEGDNLTVYRDHDYASVMGFGEPLLRLALISEGEEGDEKTGNARYYMVMTIHHVLYDLSSQALILDQLEAAYNGALLTMSQFAPLVKYIQDTKQLAEAFWKKEAAKIGEDAAVFPFAPSPSYHPTPDSVARSFLDLAGENTSPRFTLSTQLQLTWQIVMHHFTSSEAVVFGVQGSGRGSAIAGIESVTGPTEATFPRCVRLTPSMTIEEALQNVQETAYWTMPFEHFGLHNMKKLSDRAQKLCDFQSLLVLRPRQAPSLSGFLRHIPAVTEKTARLNTYPLIIECRELDADIKLEATYDARLLSPGLMQRVLHHFKYVFAEIRQDLTRRVARISSINNQDMVQLARWYEESQERTLAEPATVHNLIDRQCQAQPGAAAVHAWDGDFSYRDIQALSAQLAKRLVGEGILPESIVPICFEKSKWLAVILVAVAKAGAAFVLLDPSTQPLERMKSIVDQVKGKLLITSESLLSTAVQLSGTRPLLVGEGAPCFECDATSPSATPLKSPNIPGRNAFYVIFTSGSTGTPKGVVIEHHGYTVGALSRSKVTGLGPSARVLQFSSCTFDTFITDIFDTLIVGACICITSDSDRHASLAQAARDMRVTYADLVPSVARLLRPEDVSTLATLVLSGEAVTKNDVATWADNVRLCNLYGPAECSAVATGHAFAGMDSNPSNIGRACGGTCWVANPVNHDVLLPIGAVGELLVEGSIVGRGYLGPVPGQACSNFLDNAPTWRRAFPGGDRVIRMYKTGDLVQYQNDGTLLFIGRKDDQVKLHGQRLELGDVEYHLRNAYPQSRDVVAAILPPPAEQLVAFIVVSDAVKIPKQEAPTATGRGPKEGRIDAASSPEFRHRIRDAEKILREFLPTYMVPAAYIPVGQLPRTSSGKVDRARLRQTASELILRQGLASFTAARERIEVLTETEKALQSIWAQVLGIAPMAISAENGFLGLGGDSIAGMRVAAKAAERGLHISIPKLFQNESLRNLTAGIDSQKAVRLINWEAELAFPEAMHMHTSHYAETTALVYPQRPNEVLLTGATGRLGREIVKQLVECASIGKVHCVAVRQPETLPAHEKVIWYHGDLSMPRVGMSEQEETIVSQRCCVIIHCGAVVSFVQNYETMRSVNVESTKYLASLALSNRARFHYISTAGVGQNGGDAVLEEVSAAWNEPPVDGADGYTATKWVSEVFLERVSSRFGLDVTIHRPSNIVCDGDPATDIVNNLLVYSRRLGKVARLEGWEGHFDFIRGNVLASDIVQSVVFKKDRAKDGTLSAKGVRYVHESGEAVIPVHEIGVYLAKDDCVPLEAISMRIWVEEAMKEGMAKVVGDFLLSMEEDGEKMVLPLIKSSRRPAPHPEAANLEMSLIRAS